MKHTISVLVENEFGVLTRVAGLFSGRGFNIESLSVAPTLDPSISRMTIVTRGDEQILEQITKQLNKLIDTIKVIDFTGQEYVAREMAMVKVNAENGTRAEVCASPTYFARKWSMSLPGPIPLKSPGRRIKSTPSSSCCSPWESRNWCARDRSSSVAAPRDGKGRSEAGRQAATVRTGKQ